jgi:hypothetical protein
MPTKTRRTAAEINALKAEQRANAARKAELEAEKKAQPKPAPTRDVADGKVSQETSRSAGSMPAPKPAYQPIVREVLRGMRSDAPLYGQVIPIDERSYKFNPRIDMQSGPGLVQLEVASTPDGPYTPMEAGWNQATMRGSEGSLEWRWRRFLRWRVEPFTRKEFVTAVSVEFLYDNEGLGDVKHKPRYNPDIRAFELVVG